MPEHSCQGPGCQTAFRPRHPSQRFCSARCRARYWQERYSAERAEKRAQQRAKRLCRHCGSPFDAAHAHQQYCKLACRTAQANVVRARARRARRYKP